LISLEFRGCFELGDGELVVVGQIPEDGFQLHILLEFGVDFLEEGVVTGEVLDEGVLFGGLDEVG
jgi:hypothetical protein